MVCVLLLIRRKLNVTKFNRQKNQINVGKEEKDSLNYICSSMVYNEISVVYFFLVQPCFD